MTGQIPLFYTAQEQSSEFRQRLLNGFKGDCPCCGRHAQVYNMQISSGSAAFLVKLSKFGVANFVHYSDVTKLMRPGFQAGAYTLPKHWGLIEAAPNDDEAKPASGYWAITQRGLDFVHKRCNVSKTIKVFDDHVIGYSEDQVDIVTALGKKFDYQELMS